MAVVRVDHREIAQALIEHRRTLTSDDHVVGFDVAFQERLRNTVR